MIAFLQTADPAGSSNKKVRNVAICKDSGMQFYIYRIVRRKVFRQSGLSNLKMEFQTLVGSVVEILCRVICEGFLRKE